MVWMLLHLSFSNSPFVTGLQGLTHGVDVADTFEGVIESAVSLLHQDRLERLVRWEILETPKRK